MDRAFLPKVLFALTLFACGDSKSSTESPGGRGGDDGAVPSVDANTPADRDATFDDDDASRGPSPSPDASEGAPDAGGDAGQVGTPAGSPVFVAVGYAGRRVRSLDLGVTWIDDATLGGGGDDEYLLRAAAFGHDMFVAVGWKILTSPDGRTWTERTIQGQQWIGGISFGNGRFVGAGGYGRSFYSTDGITWRQGGNLGTERTRSVAFNGDVFFAATDSGNWWSSSDGTAWQVANSNQAQSQIAYCSGEVREASQCSGHFNSRSQASGEGVIVRARDGALQRSTDAGASFATVLNGSFESVAFGYAK